MANLRLEVIQALNAMYKSGGSQTHVGLGDMLEQIFIEQQQEQIGFLKTTGENSPLANISWGGYAIIDLDYLGLGADEKSGLYTLNAYPGLYFWDTPVLIEEGVNEYSYKFGDFALIGKRITSGDSTDGGLRITTRIAEGLKGGVNGNISIIADNGHGTDNAGKDIILSPGSPTGTGRNGVVRIVDKNLVWATDNVGEIGKYNGSQPRPKGIWAAEEMGIGTAATDPEYAACWFGPNGKSGIGWDDNAGLWLYGATPIQPDGQLNTQIFFQTNADGDIGGIGRYSNENYLTSNGIFNFRSISDNLETTFRLIQADLAFRPWTSGLYSDAKISISSDTLNTLILTSGQIHDVPHGDVYSHVIISGGTLRWVDEGIADIGRITGANSNFNGRPSQIWASRKMGVGNASYDGAGPFQFLLGPDGAGGSINWATSFGMTIENLADPTPSEGIMIPQIMFAAHDGIINGFGMYGSLNYLVMANSHLIVRSLVNDDLGAFCLSKTDLLFRPWAGDGSTDARISGSANGDLVLIPAAGRYISASSALIKTVADPVEAQDAATKNYVVNNASIVTSGTAAPSSTPTKVGNIYIDTNAGDVYVSKGTSGSGDWVKVN